MDLEHVTYTGPAFEEKSAILGVLPANLLSLLRQVNGFIQFNGGLHLRGVCREPAWHSIEMVFNGPLSLQKAYTAVAEGDIPFAQDCVGDQFLLRAGTVIRLSAETGAIGELGLGLAAFLEKASEDPVGVLGMHPLLELQSQGGKLEPGELISVYPPFCTREAKKGVSLKAAPASEVLRFLFELSRRISGLGDGEQVSVQVVE